VRKTVPVAELKLGMYVAELDRPWTDTPFKFQGFVLEKPEQIEILQKSCKVVFVDPDKSEVLGRLPDNVKSALDLSRTKVTKYAEQAPIEHEFANAARHHGATATAMREAVMGPLQAGGTLDAQRINEAVNGLTESVLRNPDAMLLFTQLKEKSDYTHSHALDCSVFMMVFGRFLEMSREDIALLGHLGLLQDVGKVRLPTTLLEKRERLSEDELGELRKHVEHSADILGETPQLPANLAELAVLHHERYDGSGYPQKLHGKDIGLVGSIAGIVDTFDALTARRPYAEPVPPSAHRPDLDPRLEAICLKAMARAPEDRYAAPRALIDDLKHWLADEPVSAWPASWQDRPDTKSPMTRWTWRTRQAIASDVPPSPGPTRRRSLRR